MSTSWTPWSSWRTAGPPPWATRPTAGGCPRWAARARARTRTGPTTAMWRTDASRLRPVPGGDRRGPGGRLRGGSAPALMRFLRSHSLSLFFLAIFIAALVGQAVTGQDSFNHAQVAHHGEPISLGRYVTSSSYWADVLENWQSEYLQFTLYIFVTVWLVQKGSPESKKPEQIGTESDKDQQIGAHAGAHSPRWARVGGLRTRIYSNSLLIVMLTIWLASWLGQSVTGRIAYNPDHPDH